MGCVLDGFARIGFGSSCIVIPDSRRQRYERGEFCGTSLRKNFNVPPLVRRMPSIGDHDAEVMHDPAVAKEIGASSPRPSLARWQELTAVPRVEFKVVHIISPGSIRYIDRIRGVGVRFMVEQEASHAEPHDVSTRQHGETRAHMPGRVTMMLQGKRILVVEDDDRLYCALKDALQDVGCEVFGSCVHVASLWDSAPNAHVDAALIDNTGAPQILALIRQLHDCGIPIVLISARDSDESSAGRSAHARLTKPFTEEDLVYAIVGATGGSTAESFQEVELPLPDAAALAGTTTLTPDLGATRH